MKLVLKNQYQVVKHLREDLLSHTYQGSVVSSSIQVLVKEYSIAHVQSSHIRILLGKLDNLKRLVHPSLIKLIDYELLDNKLYLVYEYPEGVPLSEKLNSRTLFSMEQLSGFVERVVRGLEFLYGNSVYHGALNPDSVYILNNGSVKLIDYVVGSEIALHYIQYHALIDNACYFAPEQLSRGVTTRASDIYSLGILMYRLITGKIPYKNNFNIKKLLKEIKKGVTPPKKLQPRMPSFLNKLILNMIKEDKSARYKQISGVTAALEQKNMTYTEENTVDEVFHVPPQDYLDLEAKKKLKKTSFMKRMIFVSFFALVFGGGMAYVYSLYLSYFSSIPEVVVPDLCGVKDDVALETLHQMGLKPEIAGYIVDNAVSANHVISTMPQSGRVVKSARLVQIFVSKGEGMAHVPTLIGMRYEEALQVLERMNLVPTVSAYAYSNTFQQNIVVAQNPTPNHQVAPKSIIGLTVSRGYPVDFYVYEVPGLFGSDMVTVQIKFAIVEGWDENKVRVDVVASGNAETIYEEIHIPGDTMLLEFEEHKTSHVVIYFNGDVAFETDISDHIKT